MSLDFFNLFFKLEGMHKQQSKEERARFGYVLALPPLSICSIAGGSGSSSTTTTTTTVAAAIVSRGRCTTIKT